MDHTVVKERSCQKAKFRMINTQAVLKNTVPHNYFFTAPESAGFFELNFHNHLFYFLGFIVQEPSFSHFWELTVIKVFNYLISFKYLFLSDWCKSFTLLLVFKPGTVDPKIWKMFAEQ